MLLFPLLLAIAPAASAGQAPPPGQSTEECDGSQAERLACLQRTAARAGGDVTQAEQALLTALRRWDEEPRFAAAARQRLAESRTAYARYRAAQCGLHAALGGGAIGSALEMRRLNCAAALDSVRAGELRRLASQLPRR